jgi:hypothetical protein
MKTIETKNLLPPRAQWLEPVATLLLYFLSLIANAITLLGILGMIFIIMLSAGAMVQRHRITANIDTLNKAIATENPGSLNNGRIIIYNLVADRKITPKEADAALKNLNEETINWEPASKKFIKKPSDKEKQKEKDREKWLSSHKQLLSGTES